MERKTIIWTIGITALLLIAGFFGGFFWLNPPLNAMFGPEPSTYCTQDSDCRYSVTTCEAFSGGCTNDYEITNTEYPGPFCPLPNIKGPRVLCKMTEPLPDLQCVINQCVQKRD